MIPTKIQTFFRQIRLPDPASHKGQNGKLLIIGGSELFHAASKWSLDVASKIVDMVFYSSIPSNNTLIEAAKGQFWNGIVVPRGEVEAYLVEADCVLIGPGMERQPETERITNHLLRTYPEKKWVIDAGALQMADPRLFTQSCILTPHYKELMMAFDKYQQTNQTSYAFGDFNPQVTELDDDHMPVNKNSIKHMSQELEGVTVLLKGALDYIGDTQETVVVAGGHPGMTKGGTGDVLAGIVAALYCRHEALTAAVVGSYVNKKAGEQLAESVGPYFNASDLVETVPAALWEYLQVAQSG